MSLDAMKAAFALQNISPTDCLVLLALGNFADEGWRCFPSKATLATMTKLSERAISMAMKRLEEDGYLVRESQFRGNGSNTSNRYTLHLGDGGEFAAPSAFGSPPPRNVVHPVPAADAPPEPSLNPQKEVVLMAPDPFEGWWSVYPRKQAKVEARKAWAQMTKAIAALTLAELMVRTEAFAQAMVSRDPEKIAHGATWLRGERWNDQLPTPRSQTDGQSRQPAGRTGPTDFAAERLEARDRAMLAGAAQAADGGGRRRWRL